ncbi:DMT family transporter [Cellulosimicrobium cellulans]|uniref:DMT family transporter n=1 Tax=Cellulosimicrobium cellulans TaxID=1710 RepID=UPI001964C6D4|nr:DMT family transporter [Cellulosimicrobium cellulans]MBN0042508.1 DMT family transporter [Cellulosimicrobium cellulans]
MPSGASRDVVDARIVVAAARPREVPVTPSTLAPGPATRVTLAALVAAGSGAVLSLQGRFNGDLATAGTGPVVAGWLSYVGTLLATVLVVVARRRARSTLHVLRAQASWWWFTVGLCSVPIVVAMAAGVPLVGVAVASVCSVAGQTVAGLALDARGVGLPAPLRLTPRRAAAGLAALVGLGVAVLGGASTGAGWVPAVLAGVALFVGGAVLCGQQAGNGRVTQLTGDPVVATLTSVTGGLVGISAVCAVVAALGGLDGVTLPGRWWLYLGGPLGTLVTVAAAFAVRHLGTFVLTLTVVGGQMVMAVLLDVLGAVGLRWQTVVATAVVGIAVLLVVQRPGARSTDRDA